MKVQEPLRYKQYIPPQLVCFLEQDAQGNALYRLWAVLTWDGQLHDCLRQAAASQFDYAQIYQQYLKHYPNLDAPPPIPVLNFFD